MAKKNTNEPYIEPVMTHNVLIDTMEKLGFGNSSDCTGMKILVINNYDVALQYAMENEVTYITADKECYDKFNFFTSSDFGDDDNCILVEEDNWLDTIKKVLDMKFDVAIMNPPYEKNLHYKIINEVKKNVSNIINISPIGKMQHALIFGEPLPVENMAIDRITMDKANEIFPSVEIREDLGIWYNGNCSTNIVPKYNLVCKLINKMKAYNNGLIADKFEKTIGNFPVKFVYGATIAGNGGHGRACYRIISDNAATAFSTKPTGHVRYINVTNMQEQIDLQRVYNLTFLRFCYYIIERGNTPYTWLPVFDNTYTNQKFCTEFNINGYISDTKAVSGSEWETILETMKDFM